MAQRIEIIIDGFFSFIYNIEKRIAGAKSCMESEKFSRCSKWCGAILFVIAIVIITQIHSQDIPLPVMSIIYVAVLLCACSNFFKWAVSVVKILGILIVFNFMTAGAVVFGLFSSLNRANEMFLFLAIYILLWIAISLIANSRVSSIANGFIGAISTVLFTVFSYVLSLYPSDYAFSFSKANIEYFAEHNLTAMKFFQAIIGLLLPFIGATALSLALIEAKKYWLQKNNLEEPY